MKWWIVLIIILISLSFVSASSIFLSDYLEEGETTVYETEDGVYVISLLSVSDNTEKAVFRLNDEMSKGIKKGDSYVFKDDSEVVLRDLVINDAEDGTDEAYYYFYGTGEGVLDLRNVSRYVVENNLCNFDTQCLNETKEDCCYDCGCDSGECINNKCVGGEEEVEEEQEEVEEKEEEVEVKRNISKEDGEKKVATAIMIVIIVFILLVVWRVYIKRRSIF